MFDEEPTSESTARPAHLEESLSVICRKPTRKRVLAALARADETLSLDELARAVAGTDDPDAAPEASEDDADVLRVPLYHCDLPKLEQYELVAWDSDERRSTLTTRGAACVDALGL